MADYYPVLTRAIAGLDANTGDSRRAVYDRARAALVAQLRGYSPPLSEAEITRERLALEECVRRIEAEQRAATAAADVASRGAPPPPPPQQTQRPSAPASGSRPAAAATARAADPYEEEATGEEPSGETEEDFGERETIEPGRNREPRVEPRFLGEQGFEETRRRSGEMQSDLDSADAGGRRGLLPMLVIGGLVLLLLAAGVGAYTAREQIAGLLGLGGEGSDSPASTEPVVGSDPPGPRPVPKVADRVQQQGAPSQPAAPPAAAPRPGDVARVAPGTAAPSPAPATQAPQPGVVPVAQRAILYEESGEPQGGTSLEGTVLWRTESVSGGQGQPLETALRGEVTIPARNLRVTLVLRRNTDSTLPASHTIEVQFTLPANFANAGIANVPGLIMKAEEQSQGAALAGLSVRVTGGFFLIGLSSLDSERAANEQLLRDRDWIDIPILYDNGRRAVLTLEKGTPGEKAFNDALAAWRAAGNNSSAPSTTPQ
jgi:hypothetical protein